MGKKDKRVDAYIARSADFAQPILSHLRELVHKACPDVEETIKWGFAAFDHKGAMCTMASFKQHCAFGFWKAAIMKDAGELTTNQNTAMGHLGKITSLKVLPTDKKLIALIKEAAKLNEDGIKLPAKPKLTAATMVATPDYFLKELKKNKKAFSIFEAFAPSHRKEYNQWIIEAKTEETRNRRMAQAIEWIAECKGRNWKYEKSIKN